MTNKEFSDGTEYEFAMGSLQGLRSWNVDEKGRLVAASLGTVWRPGENVAECFAVPYCPRYRSAPWSMTSTGEPAPCSSPDCTGRYHTAERHTFEPNCDCGFWAFSAEDFYPHATVIGVIEAWGKTAIGSKGFRAEKAKILALYTGGKHGHRMRESLTERLAVLYPDAMQFRGWKNLLAAYPGLGTKRWCEVDEGFWDKDEELERRRESIKLTMVEGRKKEASTFSHTHTALATTPLFQRFWGGQGP